MLPYKDEYCLKFFGGIILKLLDYEILGGVITGGGYYENTLD